MKKIFAVLGIFIVILAVGVFAETAGLSPNVEEAIKKVTESKGINESQIKDIQQVDFNNLPDEVKIANIDKTNIAMYQVDYGDEKPIYVITVSNEAFQKTVEATANKMFLDFGYSKEFKESTFLLTPTGVQTNSEKGYVMIRDGSITGISTNLELSSKGAGEVEVIIYKNGEQVGFRNSFSTEGSSGVKSDYDSQSEGVVTFEKGDIISAYVKINGDVNVKDVITLIEITSNQA